MIVDVSKMYAEIQKDLDGLKKYSEEEILEDRDKNIKLCTMNRTISDIKYFCVFLTKKGFTCKDIRQ